MDLENQRPARAGMRIQQGPGKGLRNCTCGGRRACHLDRPRRRSARQDGSGDPQAFPDIEVTEVAGDITTPEGREAALTACADPDILVNNAGGPPPGDFRNWTPRDWIKALDANMLTPIELIKATIDGMIARRFGRIVNITSAAVKAPIDVLGLSNGARTGLTGFVAGLSRKTVRHNVTINKLLPGAFDTDRLRSVTASQAKAAGLPVEDLRASG